MPKIIENLREALLAEARRQISERGYRATTVRSIAAGCEIAVGTVYNYFASKDMMIASFMLEDWLNLLEPVRRDAVSDSREHIFGIWSALREFSRKYTALFDDEDAVKAYNAALGERHKLLLSQLAELILPVCGGLENAPIAAAFIAEPLLSMTMAGESFGAIYSVIEKIIK